MKREMQFTLNGEEVRVEVDPVWTLLHVLREVLELTGTKFGCGYGECGACTVIVNGKAVRSCLTKVANLDGAEVITVEGLGTPQNPHLIQEAFVLSGAIQCGYCTPGMIMGVVGLLRENAHPTEDDIKTRMQRHLCRCGDYSRFIKAIRRAATPQQAK